MFTMPAISPLSISQCVVDKAGRMIANLSWAFAVMVNYRYILAYEKLVYYL